MTKKNPGAGQQKAAAPKTTTKPDDQKAQAKAAETEIGQAGGDNDELEPETGGEGFNEAAVQAAARAREAEAEEPESVHTVEQVRIAINRDNSRTIRDVLAHEVAIYKAIHGEDAIEEVASREVDVADLDFDAELHRLRRKFGRNGEKHVNRLFADGRAIATALGLKYVRDHNRERSQFQDTAMIVDFSVEGASISSNAPRTVRVLGTTKSRRAAAKEARAAR